MRFYGKETNLQKKMDDIRIVLLNYLYNKTGDRLPETTVKAFKMLMKTLQYCLLQ